VMSGCVMVVEKLYGWQVGWAELAARERAYITFPSQDPTSFYQRVCRPLAMAPMKLPWSIGELPVP
jgi:hypothetical protein